MATHENSSAAFHYVSVLKQVPGKTKQTGKWKSSKTLLTITIVSFVGTENINALHVL